MLNQTDDSQLRCNDARGFLLNDAMTPAEQPPSSTVIEMNRSLDDNAKQTYTDDIIMTLGDFYVGDFSCLPKKAGLCSLGTRWR